MTETNPVIIPTEKTGVMLRELTETDDIEYYLSYNHSRPEIARFDPDSDAKHRTLEDTTNARLNAVDKVRLGIWDGNKFVGSINVTTSDVGTEIGYWTDTNESGKGYATLATRALARRLAITSDHIFAKVKDDNFASQRVLEKSGFSPSAIGDEITYVYEPENVPTATITKEVEIKQPEVLVGLAESAVHGQDVSLVDTEHNLFGVFDGLGAYPGSERAAQIAAEHVKEVLGQPQTDWVSVYHDMVRALGEAHLKILEELPRFGAATTAVIAQLVRSGDQTNLVWASVGDSRIYIKKSGEYVKQLSQDEGAIQTVTNCLGYQSDGFKGVYQYGFEPIEVGEEFLLVSDGITGDIGDELLSDEEINDVLEHSPHPNMAARGLEIISRKRDDKTAIVVKVVG